MCVGCMWATLTDPLGLGQGSWNKIGRESATAVVLIALKIVVLECRPGAKSKITR